MLAKRIAEGAFALQGRQLRAVKARPFDVFQGRAKRFAPEHYRVRTEFHVCTLAIQLWRKRLAVGRVVAEQPHRRPEWAAMGGREASCLAEACMLKPPPTPPKRPYGGA